MNLTRYLALLFFGLVIVVLIVVLFFSNNSSQSNAQLNQKLNNFAAYSNTDSVASVDINGPINGQSIHNEAKISVSSSEVNLQVYQGYDGSVIKNETFPNSQNSYAAFLRALYINGFDSTPKTNSVTSPVGICSSGDTYSFSLTLGSTNIVNAWQTNCLNDIYTYNGKLQYTLSLFEQQVPNYNSYIANLNF